MSLSSDNALSTVKKISGTAHDNYSYLLTGKTKFCLSLFIFGLCVFTYWQSLSNGFSNDDTIYLVNNPDIKSLKGIDTAFRYGIFPGNLYRPLAMVSYVLTYHYYKLEPFAYHLQNVILHGGIVVLLFLIISRFLSPITSLTTPLLFAISPINTETVVTISGRNILMSVFFGLCSIYCIIFLKEKEREFPLVTLFLTSLTFGACIFSHESGYVFIILTLLILYYCNTPGRPQYPYGFKFAFIFPSFFYLLLRYNALGFNNFLDANHSPLDNPLIMLSFKERIYYALILLSKYFFLVLTPVKLNSDYSYAHLTLNTPDAATSNLLQFILVILLFILTVWGLIKKNQIGFFLGWFFTSFVLTSNIFFPIGTIFSEKLVYLPSVGIIGLLSLVFYLVPLTLFRNICISIYSCLLIMITLKYIPTWKNNESLVSYQILHSPESAKANVNYAVYLRNIGKLDEALLFLDKASLIAPEYEQPYYIRGTILIQKQDFNEAVNAYKKALELNGLHTPSMNAAGRVFLNQEKYEDAKQFFMKAYEIDKRNYESLIGLLAVAINKKDFDMAIRYRDSLTKRDPSNQELLMLNEELGKRITNNEH
jgi:protein O-mannosyl-transferase